MSIAYEDSSLSIFLWLLGWVLSFIVGGLVVQILNKRRQIQNLKARQKALLDQLQAEARTLQLRLTDRQSQHLIPESLVDRLEKVVKRVPIKDNLSGNGNITPYDEKLLQTAREAVAIAREAIEEGRSLIADLQGEAAGMREDLRSLITHVNALLAHYETTDSQSQRPGRRSHQEDVEARAMLERGVPREQVRAWWNQQVVKANRVLANPNDTFKKQVLRSARNRE